MPNVRAPGKKVVSVPMERELRAEIKRFTQKQGFANQCEAIKFMCKEMMRAVNGK